jgi:HlyD family secretion protein
MSSPTAPWDAKRNAPRQGWLRKLITWTLVLGVLGLVGYGLRPRPIEVELGLIKRGPLTVHVVEEGKTRVRNRYVVSAPVAGQMKRVTLRAGDAVKSGETVITSIEPAIAPLLDPRAKAQADARVQVAEAARMQANQSLSMAKTAEKFALSNWTRVQALNEKGSISVTDRENAERDASMKQQEVRGAEFALKVAEFELQQAKAALLQWESPGTAGSTIEVKSPVSGKVLRVQQESAMVVAPGTALVEIGDPSDIEIEAEILSRDAIAITPKAPVVVEQWGGPEALRAEVRLVEPAAFTKVSALGVEEQRVLVRSDLINPPALAQSLGDRYRVEVRIAIWHSDDVLLIPAGALFREGSEWKTFVFRDGKAMTVTIDVGHTDGRQSEVLKGIASGDQVLLHPPDTVKDGVQVVQRVTQ